jgi:uncharacterized protein (DUF1778 family)
MKNDERAQIAHKTTSKLKELIREAADYLGQDMTGFITGAAVQAARKGREPQIKAQSQFDA